MAMKENLIEQKQLPDHINAEEIKVILSEILTLLSLPENSMKIRKMHEDSRNDMVALIQAVLPFVTKVQQDVICNHGFSPDTHGIITFTQYMRMYESQDQDIATMAYKLKSYTLPPVMQ